MKKKATKKGKAKASRKRSATRDLSARKAGAVKGGLLTSSQLLPAVQADGSVRNVSLNFDKISPTYIK